MKKYRIILVSFILLVFMMGAVCAASNEETTVGDPIVIIPDDPIVIPIDPINPGDDPGNVEVTEKEIYVNSTGDDSNVGTKESPYATVNKAVSDVTDSNDATIYIDQGTYFINNLNINLNHKLNGGNLKIIGAGADKTILDGQSMYYLTIGANSNVTIKDITLINCNNRNGGTIVNNGNLTVDNCIFRDSKATTMNGGAIYSMGSIDLDFIDGKMVMVTRSPNLNIINSKFISCLITPRSAMAVTLGGAIYANSANLYMENNTFINTTAGQGSAIYAFSSKTCLINNKFINITGDRDASIWIEDSSDVSYVVTGNEFINCTSSSDTYSIVSLNSGNIKFENNTFINSENSVGNIYVNSASLSILKFQMNYTLINLSNAEINKGFKISNFTITDDMGNIIGGISNLDVNLENAENSISIPSIIENGEIMVTFSDVPENGIYNLTLSKGNAISDVLATVNISLSNNLVEFWVSPEGSNANNGTVNDPFATIQYAIDAGFDKSFNVTVHLLKGIYSKEGNVELTIANKGALKILGEYNETVIDGENTHWLLSISTTDVMIDNLKFINGLGGYNLGNVIYGGNSLVLKNCILENNGVSIASASAIAGAIEIDNLLFINNKAKIAVSNSNITNSKFINNTSPSTIIQGSFTSINNYYANNSNKYIIQVTGDSKFIGDTFINNFASVADSVVSMYYSTNNAQYATPVLTFEDCKFVNNSATKGGAVLLKAGSIINCSFTNNTADYGGAIYLIPYIKEIESNENNEGNSLELIDVTFKDNVAKFNGNDIYLEKPANWPASVDEDSTYAYGIPLTVTFNDKNVTSLSDDLTATVYGPCGAVIGVKYVTFELNGTIIGSPEVINSVATLNYAGFEEGNYILSGNTEYPDANIINSASIIVKFENILDHVDIWVSVNGSDESGNGSQSNPFKSISKAKSEATKNSRDVTIYIGEGTYAGDLNTALTLSCLNNVTLIGEGIDKTVIDGEGINYFAEITKGKNSIIISNMTIRNMSTSIGGTIAPIHVDENSTLYLDNVEITGLKSSIIAYGPLFISDSIVTKNMDLFTSHNLLCINNTLISSSLGQIKGKTIINNSVIRDILTTSSDCALLTQTAPASGMRVPDRDNYCIVENTVISNDCNSTSFEEWGIGNVNGNIYPAVAFYSYTVNVNNVSVVNNYGSEVSPTLFGSVYWFESKVINAYNSSFTNFGGLWSVNTYAWVNLTFDGCVFNNISMIGWAATFGEGSYYDEDTDEEIELMGYCIINNSVFINSDPVIDRGNRDDRKDPICIFENNYWGSNDKPVVTFVNPGKAKSVEPATWIALYSEDNQTVIKNITDGENSTAYLGNAPIRTDYADNKGALDRAVVFGDVGFLFTTDDETNVIFNASEPIYPFVAADPMDYRTPTVIVITGFEGDLNIVGMLVDIVGNPIANATLTSTFADLAPVNTTTDANGTFKVKAGKNGVLKVVFAGDDTYFDTEGNLTFANAGKTAKTFINFNEVEGDFAITGVLVDDEGTPIANAAIKAIINSNTTVNTTTDDKGVFKVQGLSNCVIDVIFAGDDVYNPSNATITLNNLAPARAATVIEGNNYTQNAIEYKLGERGGNFTVQLKDASGKALANKTVLIGYNGKCLERTTDENGYANVQINLASENRLTFAVAFLGDDEYNATMSVYLITITKKAVTISAPDKTYKASAKTKSYTVTLSTVKGVDGKTYFGAGKKVTLKVDGKTYTAKTNDKGQATFKLNMAKKGTFKATVSYAGDGTYQAATKTSKIKIN